MFGPLVIKPGTSRNNKTGSWRTGLKPKFLKTNCVACRICILVCPENCIYGREKNTYEVDYDFCKGCGLCAEVCPKKDVVMIKEEDKI